MQSAEPLGMVLVISGPSGVGKDTVWKSAQPCLPTFSRAITCTTRERRQHEVEGRDYYFVPQDEFARMIKANELVEHAEVHGNFYGVPNRSIFERINNSRDVVCVIDVQGAMKIRNLFPTAVLVFIMPPKGHESEVLAQRILGRQWVEQAELETRLQTASWELTQVHLYDFLVVNDNVERASNELCLMVNQEKERRARRLEAPPETEA
ncbi:guanylate kinase [Abditibacteriota bacterium]|nr:guanylate kinase [Abditibacteriota bacterium]